jgi:two-component system sensor histidine kinase KdpD
MWQLFPVSALDNLITLAVLVLAFILSAVLQIFIQNSVAVSLIFVLSVLIVSRLTSGYLYGIIASVAAVFGVNYAFTYPYFELDFTLTGYPLTFIMMLVVSVTTCALTSQI